MRRVQESAISPFLTELLREGVGIVLAGRGSQYLNCPSTWFVKDHDTSDPSARLSVARRLPATRIL